MDQRMAVIGLGYAGVTAAVCLARLGHRVTGYDIDPHHVADLAAARMPIREEGLDTALAEGLANGRLHFVADLPEAIDGANLIFLCTGTPQGPDGRPDLSQLFAAVDAVLTAGPDPDAVLVVKSTVPPGTTRLVQARLATSRSTFVHVASNPEFLREGVAVHDFLHPARVVIGTDSPVARERLEALYAPLGAPFINTDPTSAELVKYGSNAFLAMKISFINALADLCEHTGADIDTVAVGVGLDPRIGRAFLRAGAGYGGSCLPKDVAGLIHVLQEHDADPGLFAAVQAVNLRRVDRLMDKLRRHLPTLSGARVAILGLAFKPGTDDVREAPSGRLVVALLEAGANLQLHDPWATANFQRLFPADPQRLGYFPDPREALQGADAAILMTEWPEYRQVDAGDFTRHMRRPVLVDGRNLFDPEPLVAGGVAYEGIGRRKRGGAAE